MAAKLGGNLNLTALGGSKLSFIDLAGTRIRKIDFNQEMLDKLKKMRQGTPPSRLFKIELSQFPTTYVKWTKSEDRFRFYE